MVKAAMKEKPRTLNRIQHPKVRRVTYTKRKECIKKKTMELGILCDTDTCAVILGPNGEVDTWPENPVEVKLIIQKYREYDKDCRSKKSKKPSEFPGDGRNPNTGFLGWNDDWLVGLSVEGANSFLRDLELKLQSLKSRIGLLDFLNYEQSNSEQGKGIYFPPNYWPLEQTIDPTAFENSNFPAYVEPLNCYGVSDEQNDLDQQSFPLGDTDNHLQLLALNEALLDFAYGFGEKSFNGNADSSTPQIDEFDGNYNSNYYAQLLVPKAEIYLQPSPLHEVLLGSMCGNLLQFVKPGFGEGAFNRSSHGELQP